MRAYKTFLHCYLQISPIIPASRLTENGGKFSRNESLLRSDEASQTYYQYDRVQPLRQSLTLEVKFFFLVINATLKLLMIFHEIGPPERAALAKPLVSLARGGRICFLWQSVLERGSLPLTVKAETR